MNKNCAIGIDLGTTYSCVGVFQNDKFEIIPNDQGDFKTPSNVLFVNNEHFIIGQSDTDQDKDLKNNIFNLKRFIGRQFNDPIVQANIKNLYFSVICGDGSKPIIQIDDDDDKKFQPEDLLSLVLAKMKQTAEKYLGQEVKDAVISIPALFSYSQRDAVRYAAEKAGLNAIRLINETNAAAIAYGLSKNKEENILVFSLGGGILEICILAISSNLFEVKSISSCTNLGGEEFDNRLLNYCVDEIILKYRNDLSNDKKCLKRLKIACEKAKRTLSTEQNVIIEIDSPYQGVKYDISITRNRFELLCLDLFKTIVENLEKAIKDANITKTEIDEIVLVGGNTRMPKILKSLRNFFNGREPGNSINPDQAVVYGAAVQAAQLTNYRSEIIENFLLLDVIPYSIGVETAGGGMSFLIKRGTSIPFTHTKLYKINVNSKCDITIKVYEGENKMAKSNNLLGKFKLEEIEPVLNEVIRVRIKIDIEAERNMIVSAKTNGKSNMIKIPEESLIVDNLLDDNDLCLLIEQHDEK